MSKIEVRHLDSVHTLLPALCRPELQSAAMQVFHCAGHMACVRVVHGSDALQLDEGLITINDFKL